MQKYSRRVATNMVIANMIGTGIFTSLGFQVVEGSIPNAFAIVVIWVLGGILALCGATVYAEVASTFRESGGEYTFLSKLYHPSLGFTSGWISLVVGFAAPIAALALATGTYMLPLFGLEHESSIQVLGYALPFSKMIAILTLLVIGIFQFRGVKASGILQNIMTTLKVGMIVFFLICPFLFAGSFESANISFAPDDNSMGTIFSAPFAGALVWVMFAYSGWNASTYIAGNMEDPKKNLPRSLFIGTSIVMVLYVLLNLAFMYVSSFDELAGQLDIGNIVATKMLGQKGGQVFSAIFSFALISGVNAMFIAGPRVAERMGNDYSALKFFNSQSEKGIPKIAVLFLLAISLILVLTSSFDAIIEFAGLTLTIFAMLVVLGVFIIRKRKINQEGVIKSWGYPITPIIFAGFSIWMIYYFVSMDPYTLVKALLVMLPGFIIYGLVKK